MNKISIGLAFGYKYWGDINRNHWYNKYDHLEMFRNWSNDIGFYTAGHKFIFHGNKNVNNVNSSH